ncbi:MAG: hypothetical protein IKT27_05055 [Clostridia bacterium]|nr:hypothetical protein [Clostridia bacterium]
MILNGLLTFLGELFTSIGWDYIFFIGLGFEVLLAIFFIIKSHFSYEMRMTRRLLKINNWLNRNRFINANNLVEFNNLMKKTPKLMRYHWHQYMLNRDKDPSHYMSAYNLVEKPLKTSSYLSNIKTYIGATIAFAGLFLFFGLAGLSGADLTFGNLAKAFFAPFVMSFIAIIFVMIMRMRQNQNLSAFFQYHHYFNRFLDRAVTTMPEYVDFEVLFTRQEIQKGIPVLNEYLEKRARQEQEELEKARLNAMEHESFDFKETGIDGALVLERAMKETETYLNIRSRLLNEIQQLEEEIESLKRNYENTQKDYQRKMQVSKENVDRLRKQQEETTNRIENNYIKKQQADEIKKQEQLEKDNDNATLRFNQEIESLTTEIENRRTELEEKRKYVEEAMQAEYQTFSTKMYKSVYAIAEERNQADKDELISMKDEVMEELEKANQKLTEKDHEIAQLHKILEKNHIIVAENGGFYSEKLSKESKRVRRGKKNKKLDDGDEDLIYTPPEALEDEKPEVKVEPEVKTEEFPAEQTIAVAPETPVEQVQEVKEEQNIIEEQNNLEIDESAFNTFEEPAQEEIQQPVEYEPEEVYEEEVQYGDDGGWYDKDGYYRYENGAYFDPEGRYFDEFGGWYEADGITYHEPQSETYEDIEPIEEEYREYGEDGGWFDKDGYYRYENGAYFDPEGRYFDEFGGWYEEDGITYHEPEEYQDDSFYYDGVEEYLDPTTDEEYREYGGDGGWFDKDGYYRYENGAYFDPEGRYFDEYGGWFEEDGTTYHPPVDRTMARIAKRRQEPVGDAYLDIQEEKYIDRVADQEFEDEFGTVETTEETLNPVQDEDVFVFDEDFETESETDINDTTENDEGALLEPSFEEEVEAVEQEPEVIEEPEVDPVVRKPLSEKAVREIENLKAQFALSEGLLADEEETFDVPIEKEAQPQEHPEEVVLNEAEANEEKAEVAPENVEQPITEEVAKQEPKKKAGRPKKVKVEGLEEALNDLIGKSENDSETQEIVKKAEPKKKVGRPKKVKIDLSTLFDTPAESKQDKKEEAPKRGRPKKVKVEGLEEALKEDAKKPKTAKKRGRPKKEKTETKPTQPKKSRGRPKKQTTKETTSPKRGRGRPKKTVDSDLKALNKKIENENKKLAKHQQQLNKQLEESLSHLAQKDENNKDE